MLKRIKFLGKKMTSREQRKYFEALQRYEKKFEDRELYDYKMFLKRHKDDEDLDKLSLAKLKALYEKYYVNREKRNYDVYFTKPENENN
jgi:hypothetical protein